MEKIYEVSEISVLTNIIENYVAAPHQKRCTISIKSLDDDTVLITKYEKRNE